MSFDVEFLAVDIIVLGVLIYELFSVRRSIRRSRETPADKPAKPSGQPTPGKPEKPTSPT